MGLKTLKLQSSVTVKDTGQKSVIEEIHNMRYRLNDNIWYGSRDLVAEKTKPPAKQKKRIPMRSEKKGKLDDIYAIIRPQWLRHNKKCRARFAGCREDATEIHHMNGRRGFWLIISKWFLPICRSCHKFATKNSAEAIAARVTVPDNSNPEYEFNKMERDLMEKHGINPPI